MQRLIATLTIFLFLGNTVIAQVVHTEKKRLQSTEDGWTGNLDVNFSLVQNTRRIVQLGNRINAQYQKEKHWLLLLNDLTLMQVNENALQNRGYQHVRYNYAVRPYLIPEGFAQVQYNQVWKINLRFLAGAGPRFRIVENDSTRLYLGTLVMYEYEEAADRTEFNRDVRLSSYVSGGIALQPWMELNHISYFQPKLNDWSDFRISTETSLQFSVTSRLKFKSTFELSYDARPPEGLQNTFYSWKNGLSFHFI